MGIDAAIHIIALEANNQRRMFHSETSLRHAFELATRYMTTHVGEAFTEIAALTSAQDSESESAPVQPHSGHQLAFFYVNSHVNTDVIHVEHRAWPDAHAAAAREAPPSGAGRDRWYTSTGKAWLLAGNSGGTRERAGGHSRCSANASQMLSWPDLRVLGSLRVDFEAVWTGRRPDGPSVNLFMIFFRVVGLDSGYNSCETTI